MSRKKPYSAENSVYSVFALNFNMLIDKHCNGSKKDFAEMIGAAYDSVRSWSIGEYLPGGAQLIVIQEKFDVSIDWLLTGKSGESAPGQGWTKYK